METITENRSAQPYRTELPNIIFHLGLGMAELALYSVLKRTAGGNPGGVSRKSTATLARESGMSEGMVCKIKPRLARPFAMLGGKPLIVIQKSTKGDAITITDIWDENAEFFLAMKKANHSRRESDHSQGESDHSRCEPKKEHEERTKKNYPYKSPTRGQVLDRLFSLLKLPNRELSSKERWVFDEKAESVIDTPEDDWQALARFFADPQAYLARRRTLTSLLRHWESMIDRAHQYTKTHHSPCHAA